MEASYHKLLLEQAYAKESARLQESGVGRVTNNLIASKIGAFIQKERDYTICEDDILDYWTAFEKNPQYRIRETNVTDGLAQFIGFPDYSVWKVAQDVKSPPVKKVDPRRKWLILIILGMIVLLGVVLYQMIVHPVTAN
jgi:hypothetical protein